METCVSVRRVARGVGGLSTFYYKIMFIVNGIHLSAGKDGH